MKEHLVSIILPTYNEAENICDLISVIQKEVHSPKEILIMDDNSPDDTATIAAAYCKKNTFPNTRVIKRLENRGLTKSIWEGITKSRGDIVVWMDCDFSHPPQIIPQLLTQIIQGYDIAVASRFIHGGKTKHSDTQSKDSQVTVFLSTLLNKSTRFILGNWFCDYTSGFVAAKRQVFDTIKLNGDYGEYFIDFIFRAHEHNFHLCEIPYTTVPRKKGVSKTDGSFEKMIIHTKNYVGTVSSLWIKKHILHTSF